MAEPPIRVIPTTFRETIDLLKSEPLRSVERAIADRVGARILEDDSSVATNSTLAEMSVSGMTSTEIGSLLRDHRDRIVSFGVRFLEDPSTDLGPRAKRSEGAAEVVTLGTGFGIKYAIYYNFLAHRTPFGRSSRTGASRTPRGSLGLFGRCTKGLEAADPVVASRLASCQRVRRLGR